MMKKQNFLILTMVAAIAGAQGVDGGSNSTGNNSRIDASSDPSVSGDFDPKQANSVEKSGVEARIKDVARFRGVRRNQLTGYGLVVGLEGTGDGKNTPFTATLLANSLKNFGTMVDAAALQSKNIATVTVTADLPPFASIGNSLDVTVQSIGDAKSLQGGYLLQTPLYGALDKENAIAVAMGQVSIGGFNFSSGGSSVQKNHTTIGRVPAGGIVERSVPFQMVYSGKMYLELDEGDLTTSNRIVEKLRKLDPAFNPVAIDGGTIELTLPAKYTAVQAMSLIESTNVLVDTSGLVVINERTGTIVLGGNVRLGPAVIAQGSLRVVIEATNEVSQPAPFSDGKTTPVSNSKVSANETAQIGLINPVTTVADLAKVFQSLKISPRDMISILQALKEQGALKARIKIQ